MPEIFGPVMCRSTHDSEVKLAESFICHLCKLPIGVDTPYLFWETKDFRRAHENCFNAKYGV